MLFSQHLSKQLVPLLAHRHISKWFSWEEKTFYNNFARDDFSRSRYESGPLLRTAGLNFLWRTFKIRTRKYPGFNFTEKFTATAARLRVDRRQIRLMARLFWGSWSITKWRTWKFQTLSETHSCPCNISPDDHFKSSRHTFAERNRKILHIIIIPGKIHLSQTEDCLSIVFQVLKSCSRWHGWIFFQKKSLSC